MDGIGFFTRDIGVGDPAVVSVTGDSPVGPLPLWLTTHAELCTSARIRLVFDFLTERLR